MKYEYKKLDIETYLSSLYEDGFNQSKEISDEDIKSIFSLVIDEN